MFRENFYTSGGHWAGAAWSIFFSGGAQRGGDDSDWRQEGVGDGAEESINNGTPLTLYSHR